MANNGKDKHTIIRTQDTIQKTKDKKNYNSVLTAYTIGVLNTKRSQRRICQCQLIMMVCWV